MRAKLALLFGAVTMLAALAPSAQADFGITEFSAPVVKQDGTEETQAGAHPYQAETRFRLNTVQEGFLTYVDKHVKTVITDLPPGHVGDLSGIPTCSRLDLIGGREAGSPSDSAGTNCPVSSQVGTITLTVSPTGFPITSTVGLYNVKPERGLIADFGFRFLGTPIHIVIENRSDDDYGVRAVVKAVPQSVPIIESRTIFWGRPADPSHDRLRGPGLQCFGQPEGEECDATELTRGGHAWTAGTDPFLSNPVKCGRTPSRLTVDSWEAQGQYVSTGFEAAPTVGCERLTFEPRIEVTPETRAADSPAGLAVNLTFPQNTNPDGFATSSLRDARIVFPEGMAISPPSAEGLVGCSDAQLGLRSKAPVRCPDAAKIGTVEATTPLLNEGFSGGVYLREQASNDPESGEMYRLALVLANEERGVLIKLPGSIHVNRASGQITARFLDNPQLPVDEVALRLKSGPRSPLVTPRACGTYTTVAELTSWSSPVPVIDKSSFTIDQGCDLGSQFGPGLQAGTSSPLAGAYSPFSLRVTRPEGQQNVSRIDATLPEGLLAKLKGVAVCDDAAAASGNCPAASQVGTTTVGAGAGPNPLYVPQPGKAPTALYLAGPYKGAPYSLLAKVPAQAGPFDLGTVLVRNALQVDPRTAQVTAQSDPLPQILHGIPVSYRDIRVEVTRPEFTLNPTSCDPMRVTSLISSAAGASASPSERFQAAACERLAFKPKLALRLKGATKRGGHPALAATLTQKPGGTNIARTSVAMPRSEFLAQDHIRTICTRVQFAAEQCPAASVYGKARAFSPLLDRPLEGPVYLRSSSNKLPDLVADLEGQIEIELVGRIDSHKGGIRATFAGVPDAPVTKFVLKMQGGKKSLLENSTNLCQGTHRATVKMDGHSGKPRDFRPVVRAGC